MGWISLSLKSISSAKQNPAYDSVLEMPHPAKDTIKKRLFDGHARGDESFHLEIAHGWACVEVLAAGWADEGGDCVLSLGAVVATSAAATGNQTWTGRYTSP